MEQSWCLPAT